MALTRTEIELLINAKNNAQSALNQLNDQIGKVTDSTKQSNDELGRFSERTEKSGVAAQAAGVAVGMLAERMARGLVGAFKDSIDAANKLDAGLIGLSATAGAFHQDAGKAQEAAKALASDGLMSVGDAAAGLKNLLAAGFGLDQATILMNRFKDSAAFGRQGALEFGQSIVGATEGIKNGNSALVDNAGVTKNLSVILQEAGKSANDLQKASSDLSVRQAIFNGILKETNPQLGNTALYLKTAAGAQAQFNSQVVIAEQQIGKALQPALTSVLGTLTPFVQAVGHSADVLVPLGMAAAAVVIPLAAMKAQAALGIPTMAELGAKAVGMAQQFSVASGEAGSLRGGLAAMSQQSGMTVADLGLLKTAGLVAGAAFIGWQLGKVIDQLTGASSAVETFTYDLQRMAGFMGNDLLLSAQQIAAKNDVLARATQAAGRAVTDYSEAIRINTAVVQIRQAQFDKSAVAQRAAVDGELLLGKITKEQANAQLAAIDAEEQVANVRSKRANFTKILAVAEKKFQDEVKATGMTQKELTDILKKDEQGFDTWAKTVQLSDDTIKRLKDSLAAHNKEASAAAAAAKKLKDATDEIDSAGQGWQGTLAKINPELVATAEKLLDASVSAEALQVRFHLTATQTKAITEAMADAKKATAFMAEETKKYQDALNEIDSVGDNYQGTLDGINAELLKLVEHQMAAGASGTDLATVYGLTAAQIKAVTKDMQVQAKVQQDTKDSLTATADLWEQYYDAIGEGATNTTQAQIDQIERWAAKEKAHLKDDDQNWADHYNAIEAVAEAKIQNIIRAQDPIFAAWKDLNREMRMEWADTWAKALDGETSFAHAALQPFLDLKQGLFKIFGAILADFENQLLGPLMKGFSSMVGKLLGGGGMGGGGGILSLLGLAGGEGAAAMPGVAVGGLAIPGAAGGAGAAGGGGLLASLGGLGGLLGGAGAGGGGLLLGMLGKKLFGGAGAKAGAFGAGTGFATGAAIGSVVPGLGTLVGGGIGAIAGLLSGILGGGNDTKKAREAFAQQQIGVKDTAALWDLLKEKLDPVLAESLKDRALNQIGKKDAQGNTQWMQDVIAALDAATKKQQDLTAATKAQADADAAAVVSAQKRVDEVTKSMGDLDAQEQKLNDSEAPEQVMGEVERIARAKIDADRKVLENQKSAADAALKAAQDAADATAKAYQDAAAAAQAAFNGLHFPTGNPGSPGGGEVPEPTAPPSPEGQAAGGVMANRPGLVIFGEGGETEIGGPASFFESIFRKLGAGGGGGAPSVGPGQINMYMDGRKVAEVLVPWIPQVAGDLGLLPSS